MKRHEFIQGFVDRRKEHYKVEVREGRMRLSEAIMGIGDAVKDAARLWRKHGKHYRAMTREQVWPGGGK